MTSTEVSGIGETIRIAWFTRDLRLHDNPMLHAAARGSVVPVFVLDPRILTARRASSRRERFLRESLADLDRSLRARGSRLVLLRGAPEVEIPRLAAQVGACEVHVSRDVSRYARDREDWVRRALESDGRRLFVHEAVHSVIPPGVVAPSGSDHYAVFTAYWRRWCDASRRAIVPTHRRIRWPQGLVLRGEELAVSGARATFAGGETAGLARARRWIRESLARYAELRDDLGADATSRLSPYMHLGCVSARYLEELVADCDEFRRQLCWRDFHYQMMAARPGVVEDDYRPVTRRWRRDEQALEAWRTGRTGLPIVDAGMRQLSVEGWMPNRARLVAAYALCRLLGLDWRLGAAHFFAELVDGDLANNVLNWQWVAGTGADRRPNRRFSLLRQAFRYDPQARYVRRWIPELTPLSPVLAHQPWRASGGTAPRGYPNPIVRL
ncbi:MAG: deoxyribodipyrimidine photo-lyase [Acidothermus sp.]|nr:deoxyribodipyrimidine photo-lyase [Acidothermus sp.]MCL6537144.1 DNA photolyase family protein [Acidothermus sp.]